LTGYHGRPKERKFRSHYWTHTSTGGASGRRIWKNWFNKRATNRLEARLAKEKSNRKGSERYTLRNLEAKDVDTRKVRDRKANSRS